MSRFNREKILENIKDALPVLSLETLAFLYGALNDSVNCQYDAIATTALWDSYLRKREREDNAATTEQAAKMILNFLREMEKSDER